MSNKEYKKFLLVSPHTFEKLPKNKQKTRQENQEHQDQAKQPNFQNQYMKWLNFRNKLAVQAIKNRRRNSAKSDTLRKLQDLQQTRKTFDQDYGVVIQPKIPTAPAFHPKTKAGKREKKKNKPMILPKPIKLKVRDKAAGLEPLPLETVDPLIYVTDRKAAMDSLLYDSDLLTDDEIPEESDDSFNDITNDVDFLQHDIQPLQQEDFSHLSSPLFKPDSAHASTPVSYKSPSKSNLLKKLKLSTTHKKKSKTGTPIYSVQNRPSRKNSSISYMDTIPARDSDLGEAKWSRYLLGRRTLKWDSFD